MLLLILLVFGATEDGTQSVTLKITETSCDSVVKDIYGNVSDDMTLYEVCSPYTFGGTGLRVKKGVTLTIGKKYCSKRD